MNYKFKSAATLALSAVVAAAQLPGLPVHAQEEPERPELLPKPAEYSYGDEWLNVGSSAAIIGEDSADPIAVSQVKDLLSKESITLTSMEDAETLIFMGEVGDENDLLQTALADSGLTAEGMKADGYVLSVSRPEGESQNWIAIEGVDERGTFYGVQTLKQLLVHSGDTIMIEEIDVADQPAMATRGSIEGFYAHESSGGVAWTWEQRKEQVRFYGETKMNTYIYAPKDDPYHRAQWRQPYPDDQLEELAATAKVARDNHVDFVFALSPGNDINFTGDAAETDFQALVSKCQAMYDAGVRSFAIFFDDISLRTSDAGVKQAEFLNRFNEEFVKAKGDVTPLITVPTQYDSLAMSDGTGLKQYTVDFSTTLDDDIIVLWTGPAVVPDGIKKTDGEFMTSVYGDRSGIWWNYPCNDYQLQKLGMGPIYNLAPELTEMMDTFVMNPMGQAELAKITLGTGAEYSWSGTEYDADESYSKVMDLLYGDLADEMMTFAKHSSRLGASSFSCGRPDAPDVRMLMNLAKSHAAADEDFAHTEIYSLLMSEFEAMIHAADTLQEKLYPEALDYCTTHLDKLREVGKADVQALQLLAAKVEQDDAKVAELTEALTGKSASLLSGKLISENTGVAFIDEVLAYDIQPTADFTLSKTLALPNEEITLENHSSDSATEYEWFFPGASVETSKEANPVVSYPAEGVYSIRLVAKNKFGENTTVKESCIVISKDASQDIVNLCQGKTYTASGYTASSESPEKAFDGYDNTKWCSTNWGTKWLQADLGEEKSVSSFVIKHALVGGEGAGLNTRAYRIQVSNDGTNFTDVVTVTDNTEGLTSHTIPVTNARYVRLVVDKPTQGNDSAARIFEFEIYGVDNTITIPPVYQGANKALLSEAIRYAETAMQDPAYENLNEIVKTRLEAALAKAKKVEADPTAIQSEVNQAWMELTELIHYLDFTSDKSALSELVSQAALIEAELDQYTGDKDEFIAALANAREVLNSETALDASINAATERLQNAMDGLKRIVVELDKTVLNILIDTVNAADLDTYLDDGKDALDKALTAAITARDSAKTQEEIDEAAASLHNAWLRMRLKADESLLEGLRAFVVNTMSLDEADFTPEAWNTISSARVMIASAMEAHDNGIQLLSAADAEALDQVRMNAQNLIDQKTDPADKEDNKKPGAVEEDKKPVEDDSDKKASTDLPLPLEPVTVPETEKSAKPADTAKSVKTSAFMGAGMLTAGLGAGLLGLLGLNRRKNRK